MKGTIEIDLTEQIIKHYEDYDCGNCSDLFEVEANEKKGYPGKSVKRRKDGVPMKKKKKRSTKKGEYRDKSGKLCKTKGKYSDLWKKVNGK